MKSALNKGLMNKKGKNEIVICIWIFIAILVISTGIWAFYNDSQISNCLEPIAKDICEEENMTYKNHINYKHAICLSENRREEIRLMFTEDEIDGCRNK